jgi:hypothetical protein
MKRRSGGEASHPRSTLAASNIQEESVRSNYRTFLRAKGVKPLRGSLRTVRQDGHRELLPGGKLGIWKDGACQIQI